MLAPRAALNIAAIGSRLSKDAFAAAQRLIRIFTAQFDEPRIVYGIAVAMMLGGILDDIGPAGREVYAETLNHLLADHHALPWRLVMTS